jgi:hypothetical protein
MKRFTSIVLTVLIISSLSFATERRAGQFGMGWYSPTAPVGGRVWVTPTIGIDLGLGYADKNFLGSTNDRIHVNVGFPVDLVQTPSVNFFVRPGFEYQTNSRTVANELKSSAIITADFGAEWAVTDQFSLSVGHGIELRQLGGQEDKWGLSALRALGFENVGFHFYFK